MRTKPAVRSRRSSPILNSWKGSGHYKYWGAGGWVICGVGCCYWCCYLSADAANSLEQTPTTSHYPPHCITVDRIFVVSDSLILLIIDEGGPLPGRPLHKSERTTTDWIDKRPILTFIVFLRTVEVMTYNSTYLGRRRERVCYQSVSLSQKAFRVFPECNSNFQLGELSKA